MAGTPPRQAGTSRSLVTIVPRLQALGIGMAVVRDTFPLACPIVADPKNTMNQSITTQHTATLRAILSSLSPPPGLPCRAGPHFIAEHFWAGGG